MDIQKGTVPLQNDTLLTFNETLRIQKCTISIYTQKSGKTITVLPLSVFFKVELVIRYRQFYFYVISCRIRIWTDLMRFIRQLLCFFQ